MITAHIEAFSDCLEELKPLFQPHYEELALNRDRVPLDPQYDTYLAREALGELLCVTLRERGRIVAYFIGFIAPALHYRTCLTLTMDVFWLHPDYRGSDSLSDLEEGLLAEQLFRTVKEEALRRRVQRCYYGSKAHKDASHLFEQLGLQKVDVYYSAWWGDEPRKD